MSYRYTTIDVIVGVGMCAIVFGALLFFVATTGTFQGAPVAYSPLEQPTGILAGMTMLQPVLGQAIVDRALLERRTNRGMAEALPSGTARPWPSTICNPSPASRSEWFCARQPPSQVITLPGSKPSWGERS